ncbi:MAG TPA: DNA-directed RNA polymerase subunit L [Candidatus Nanoarchaeia archaeon]|nr:DNA-directed RNA polymerase subunit L [Candidatus Nanoarchaeia archaeon]
MEIDILEDKKNKLVFELKGASHTFCNPLKTELWNDDHVKVATYSIRHPLVSQPKFIIETDGEDPKKVLLAASQRLEKTNAKFKELFTKEIK